jgi:serine/threonine protein kinase
MQTPSAPSPAESASPKSGAFLQAVLRSGLLDRDQLQAALKPMPDRQAPAQATADFLVKTGKLTRFQASKLLEGAVVGLVLGPFHVLAPLGKGGMGTVYLARDTRNQQLLALKVLPPKRARKEDRMVARFLREMHMCQRVAHPNLTQTYEVGNYHGVYYIAMEFIPGKNMYRLVTDEGTLPVPRAARLFAEAAAGLEHAHQQGLIHRDLKPSNLIVTPADHTKVLDLGLALMADEIPTDAAVVGGVGYVVGTMDYIAPEQTEDPTKVNARADVYSLGCTLYYALTGQAPFPGGSTMDKIRKHRGEEPVPVGDLNPTVPVAFAALLRRMMAKRPERRFASAAAVREELLAWADQGPEIPDEIVTAEAEQEVAALEGAEASPDQIKEDIVQLPADAAPELVPEPEPNPVPFWVDFILPVAVGVLVGLILWALFWVWLLS